MEPYKSWDYCKEHCDMYQKWADSEERVYMMCGGCHVYQFHQYLKEHGQILEEGSELLAVVEAAKKLTDYAEAKVRQLESDIQAIEKNTDYLADRCRQLESVAEAAKAIGDELGNCQCGNAWCTKARVLKQALNALEGGPDDAK